jgi:DNA polymerase III subunit delta'
MAWSHIQGRDRLIDGFAHVIARQRLAHAYLFVGPEGVGKQLFARELAKALLCESPGPGLAACDRCEACLLASAGTHPDLFIVRRPEDENELRLPLVLELCRGFSLKSARGRGKVAILDDADDLNEESANCFLKTLEEPPPRSVFILIGTSLDQQLPTIVSRCQVVRFAPLNAELVRAILTRGGIAADAADVLVRLADGSPGRALALADEALWRFRRTLLQALAGPKVETVDAARGFVEFVEDAGKDTARQRRRAADVELLLIETFTDALRLHVGGEPRSAGPVEMPLLRALAERADPEKIMALVERCLEAEGQLNRYVQLALVLEGLLDGLGQILDEPAAVPRG